MEVSTGKVINTRENINIRCRLNSSEEHTWHTSQGQLNLIVDLVQNFYINWGKRQDDLELKFETLYKEHKKLEEQHSLVSKQIDLALQKLEDNKVKQDKYIQNCDYIKEETSRLTDSLRFNNKEANRLLGEIKAIDNSKIIRLVEEVKTLVLS